MLFSDERLAHLEINDAICKGFPGITETPIFDRTHLRYRNQPDLYFSTVDGALASNCRSMRPGIMSLNEQSVNEAASSQIPQLRTSERKENIVKIKPLLRQCPVYQKNTDTGTKHDVTKLTRSTPNKAQTRPIQDQNMPIQA